LVAALALFAALGLTACPEKASEKVAEKTPEKTTEKTPAKPVADATVALSTRPTAGDSVAQARFAWYLFIQAMTPGPGPGGPLTFENWTEQCSLGTLFCPPSATVTSATSKTRSFHGSPLKAANKLKAAKAAKADDAIAAATPSGIPNCNEMNSTGFPGYPAPSNVKPNPPPQSTATPASVFCEEVYVNDAEKNFVTTNNLSTLLGQQAYGKTQPGGAITLPWDAVEIKVDWVPTSSFNNPTFQCPDTTGTLYTETINGTCYAMVGFHISSKVLPNWLWATFEPNSSVTNPNRCDPKLYDSCFDPWGTTSGAPYSKGQPVPPTSAQLQQAMTAAGLNKAFQNYYLTGVQTEFVSNGKPVPLGSSFVEFNANVAPGTASCITCHRYAYFDGQPPQNPPGLEDYFGGPPYPSPLENWAAIGYACDQPNPPDNCTPIAPNSTSQDFSWLLGLMPYNNNSSAAPASTPSVPASSPSP
jgi:hypothetical protein